MITPPENDRLFTYYVSLSTVVSKYVCAQPIAREPLVRDTELLLATRCATTSLLSSGLNGPATVDEVDGAGDHRSIV